MPPASRPQWQQATALITLGAGGIVTGFSFVPKAPADLTSPASLPPVKLLALEHANGPALGSDAMLRAAIVHVARHFQRLAETRSPAEMEAMIWQYASTDGANHGPSCAAFASLTLELGSHIAGLDSWVSGGTSYPWPVHSWADGRVDPNPASPGVVSVLQDARSHGRWRPLGDGYMPKPGDWVLFDGHVEVVTKYHGGVLHTIGGDSGPNLSVNAHEYADPLADQGVAGFVDNGVGMSKAPGTPGHAGANGGHARLAPIAPAGPAAAPMSPADPSRSAGPPASADPASPGSSAGPASPGSSPGRASSAGPVTTADATNQQPEYAPRAVPVPPTVPRSRYATESRALPAQGARSAAKGEHASGAEAAPRTEQGAQVAPQPQRAQPRTTHVVASGTGGAARRTGQRSHHAHRDRGTADVPATELRPARPQRARPGEAAIPGLLKRAHQHHPGDATALPPYHRHDVPPSDTPLPGTSVQQAFIQQVAQGAMATQRKYGVPASVTIAQAIDESGWGQSVLATNDHNLFGIKGTGPAGSDVQPTQEVINGQLVNLSASFQIYQNVAQSIDAHGRLLARSGDYATAMSRRADPNAFAAALTGIYATDPEYGAKLIQLMKHYGLYRFDDPAARGDASSTAPGGAAHGHGGGRLSVPQHSGPHAGHQASRPGQAHHPGSQPHPAHSALPQPSPDPRNSSPGHDQTPTPQDPGPIGNPVPVQPGPMAWPPPAHDATPAQGGQTGAGPTVHQKGAPRAGLAADQAQAAHYDPAAHPGATPYPGRSARPAPLAHPARPAGLARTSGPAPLPDTGHRAASAASSGSAQTDSRHGQPTGHTSQGSGSGPGLANMSADAAIPGVPHEPAPQAGHRHPGRAASRLRPAHPAIGAARPLPPAIGAARPLPPAVGPARPTARADFARPTARGTAAGTAAGAQQATAPTAPPQHASTNRAGTPYVDLPAAAAPAWPAGRAAPPSRACSTLIPARR